MRSDGCWVPAAVWHSTLNAFGGAFFFGMVTGADRDRLSLLLGIAYGPVAPAGPRTRPAAVSSATDPVAGRRPERLRHRLPSGEQE